MDEEKRINEKKNAQELLVLLVDDDEMSRDIFEIVLQGGNIRVDKAESGKLACDFVCQKKYDVIFIDHMMPEMDGIETLHMMRELPANKNHDTTVIALTANTREDADAYYLNEGFDGFLAKPLNAGRLKEIIYKN